MKVLCKPEEFRLHNIIDVGLTASAMIRLFKKGEKEEIGKKILTETDKLFNAKSQEDFTNIHSKFCEWGIENISLAKNNIPASYGQIAKTFDVVLKVAVYYSHLPNCKKAQEILEWLNAAVDTRMMKFLRKHYPHEGIPTKIYEVDKEIYNNIQIIVRRFIEEKHDNRITKPVEFDDIYWRVLKFELAL